MYRSVKEKVTSEIAWESQYKSDRKKYIYT